MSNNEEKLERILDEKEARLEFFPIRYPDIWKMYKDAEAAHWIAQKIDFSEDKFDSLTEVEQNYLKMLMAFFSQSDSVVNQNLTLNFMSVVKIPEINCFYGFQTYNEQVHAETYSLAIETYIKDTREKNKHFDAILNFPAVAKKTQWAIDWIDKGSFVEKLVAFACVESIFFQSTFAGIFYFREGNLIPGFCAANGYILLDESSHYNFATYLYNNYIDNKLNTETLKRIVLECLDVEIQFIHDVLPVGMLGLTKEKLIQYCQYVADTVLTNFGQEAHFKVSQPLEYMEKLSIPRKANFFERKVTDYSLQSSGEMVIDKDADF